MFRKNWEDSSGVELSLFNPDWLKGPSAWRRDRKKSGFSSTCLSTPLPFSISSPLPAVLEEEDESKNKCSASVRPRVADTSHLPPQRRFQAKNTTFSRLPPPSNSPPPPPGLDQISVCPAETETQYYAKSDLLYSL
jgi:hypothetical protein